MSKNHNLRQILTFGALLCQPSFTDDGKIWCARADKGLHLPAKFYLNLFICWLWANFDIFGAPVPTLFTDEDQIWCAIADPWYTLMCQISARTVYSLALWRRKMPYFGLWHLVVSPIGSNLRYLSTGARLQTFPYPIVSKSFLYFLAKSCALTVRSQAWRRDRQTDRQTHRQKTQRFWLPHTGRLKSEPHQTWHADEDLEHVLAPLKLLGSDA